MTTQDSLFSGPKSSSRGPVYQGVAKQIRALVKSETVDKDRHAGTIAQARMLAHTIDIKSGHFDPAQSEYGASLAQMHKQLDELLARLAGEEVAADPFEQLLNDFATDAARAES